MRSRLSASEDFDPRIRGPQPIVLGEIWTGLKDGDREMHSIAIIFGGDLKREMIWQENDTSVEEKGMG